MPEAADGSPALSIRDYNELERKYNELKTEYDRLDERVRHIEIEEIKKIEIVLGRLSERLTIFQLAQVTLTTVASTVSAIISTILSTVISMRVP